MTFTPEGAPEGRKWYTLGRVSFELATIMPDRRTVYISDGGCCLLVVLRPP